jgi:hypothetical protein
MVIWIDDGDSWEIVDDKQYQKLFLCQNRSLLHVLICLIFHNFQIWSCRVKIASAVEPPRRNLNWSFQRCGSTQRMSFHWTDFQWFYWSMEEETRVHSLQDLKMRMELSQHPFSFVESYAWSQHSIQKWIMMITGQSSILNSLSWKKWISLKNIWFHFT